MRICIVTPAPARSRKGNRITALRWARILKELGHRVVVSQEYTGRRCDMLIALHALRSAASIRLFSEMRPEAPLIVALTGTDVYRDIHKSRRAQQSLELASRLVVLQSLAVEELPRRFHNKVRVIHQSVTRPPGVFKRRHSVFEVCAIGHLRPVKDPFRAALAARLLPNSSRIAVIHVGAALTASMERRARAQSSSNPRYRWMGELPRWRALRVLGRSRLCVLTSVMEGGANAVSEAIGLGVPVISSHIAGSVGLLGEDYPGYFAVRDTKGLAALLYRAEMDKKFYGELRSRCRRLLPLVDPDRERREWSRLAGELDSECTARVRADAVI